MSQTLKGQNKSLVCFINDDSLAESVCKNLAATLNWMPRQADCIADVMAYTSTATLIHRQHLDSVFYDYLREVYLAPTSPELWQIDPDFDWDAPFDEKYIVFGEGSEIPDDMKPFFIDVGRLNFDKIHNILQSIPND